MRTERRAYHTTSGPVRNAKFVNVHHLELFYYVAKHGGVSAASRQMPYGIQQPAISAQIIQLEDALGQALYHRCPFKLTKAGEELFAYVRPFFEGLGEMERRLRSGARRLRIGAPELVQREYLSQALKLARQQMPGMAFHLVTAALPELEKKLSAQELDLGLAVLPAQGLGGLRHKELLRVRPVLLVPAKSGFTKAQAILEKDRIDVPLLSQPEGEPLPAIFQAELARCKIEWFPSLELATLELIERYVAEGFGVGLSAEIPGMRHGEAVRVLPLEDFPPMPFGALWHGPLSPEAEWLLRQLEKMAAALCGGGTR